MRLTCTIRWEIRNTGTVASATTDFKESCGGIASEGGHQPPGFEFSASNSITTVAVTTRRPIFAIRLKNSLNGIVNRRQVRFLRSNFFAETNACFIEIAHVHHAFALTATWTDVEDESGVEFSTDISAISSLEEHIIDGSYIPKDNKGQTAEASFSDFVNLHSFISQNIDSTDSQLFVVFATAFTGTSDVSASLTWVEFD